MARGSEKARPGGQQPPRRLAAQTRGTLAPRFSAFGADARKCVTETRPDPPSVPPPRFRPEVRVPATSAPAWRRRPGCCPSLGRGSGGLRDAAGPGTLEGEGRGLQAQEDLVQSTARGWSTEQ